MGRPVINAANIPIETVGALLRGAAEVIVRADGDRDHMNKSNLTVEQSMDVSDILVCAADKLALLDRGDMMRCDFCHGVPGNVTCHACRGTGVVSCCEGAGGCDDVAEQQLGHVAQWRELPGPNGRCAGSIPAAATITDYASDRVFNGTRPVSPARADSLRRRVAGAGFFAALTPEQRERALEYRGDESFGDPEFKREKIWPPSRRDGQK